MRGTRHGHDNTDNLNAYIGYLANSRADLPGDTGLHFHLGITSRLQDAPGFEYRENFRDKPPLANAKPGPLFWSQVGSEISSLPVFFM